MPLSLGFALLAAEVKVMDETSKNQITIGYGDGFTWGPYNDEEYEAWKQEVREACAAVGLKFIGQYDPMSSTRQDEHCIVIESQSGPVNRSTLDQLFQTIRIGNYYILKGAVED